MIPTRSVGVATRFFVVLAVLVPSLFAVAAVGAHGLQQAGDAVTTLYGNTVLTSQVANDVSGRLDAAQEAALGILASTDIERQRRLQADLGETIAPEVAVGLAALGNHLEPNERKERADLDAMIAGWRQFMALTSGGQLVNRDGDQKSLLSSQIHAIMSPVAALGHDISREEAVQARGADALFAHRRRQALTLMALTLAVALCAGVGVVLWLIHSVLPRMLAYSRFAARVADGDDSPMDDPTGHDEISQLGRVLQAMAERGRRRHAYEQTQFKFTETMQLTQNEEEANRLLKRHLERSIRASDATVMNRNNSADRLEAVTPVPAGSSLHTSLVGAKPRSCLAVREARTHHQVAGDAPLVSCDVCTGCPAMSTCTPLLVAGKVIGSVLVCHELPLDAEETRRIHESVVQAAPVLGNLRNLAIAESRATTDALTGLPNKRAVTDNLKRMVAQANRTGSPLAMLMLDLDHFKNINDQFGHGRGDEVLAAFGAALRSTIRDSDFGGRFGGEEFVLLLPGSDLPGAVIAAEKIQSALASISVASLERPVTASIGIAMVPEHGGDPESLEKASDRALYAAKRNGRNRIEIAGGSDPAAVLSQAGLRAFGTVVRVPEGGAPPCRGDDRDAPPQHDRARFSARS
jgi:diguanylate cyclase (GGDEF)-like protein